MSHKTDNGLVLCGKGNYMIFSIKQDFLHTRKRRIKNFRFLNALFLNAI